MDLIRYTQYGNFEMVKNIIQIQFRDIADKSIIVKRALLYACNKGYQDIVEYLLSCNVDIMVFNGAPTYIASIAGHTQLVKYLLDNNAQILQKETLSYIALYGHIDVIHLLFQYGIYSIDDQTDLSHIHNAIVMACSNDKTIVVDYLIHKNDWSSKDMSIFLINSINSESVETVKYLVSNFSHEKYYEEVMERAYDYINNTRSKFTKNARNNN